MEQFYLHDEFVQGFFYDTFGHLENIFLSNFEKGESYEENWSLNQNGRFILILLIAHQNEGKI